MSDDVEDSITENATGPKRVTDDQGSVEQHSIPDQIAADKYLAGKSAMKGSTWPLRRIKTEPPGTV